MTWRDLTPFPDDWCEPERPHLSVADDAGANDGTIRLYFSDPVSRAWYAEWLKSRHGWTAFMTWLDARR